MSGINRRRKQSTVKYTKQQSKFSGSKQSTDECLHGMLYNDGTYSSGYVLGCQHASLPLLPQSPAASLTGGAGRRQNELPKPTAEGYSFIYQKLLSPICIFVYVCNKCIFVRGVFLPPVKK